MNRTAFVALLLVVAFTQGCESQEAMRQRALTTASQTEILELTANTDPAVRKAIAQNPDTDELVLAQLALDTNVGVRRIVASNLEAGDGTLLLLSVDESVDVRRDVVTNPAVPVEALASLTSDPDPAIRRYAVRTTRTPWAAVDQLEFEATDPASDDRLRESVEYYDLLKPVLDRYPDYFVRFLPSVETETYSRSRSEHSRPGVKVESEHLDCIVYYVSESGVEPLQVLLFGRSLGEMAKVPANLVSSGGSHRFSVDRQDVIDEIVEQIEQHQATMP